MESASTWKTYSYWIGILIVLGTHVYMLGFGLPESQMLGHAILNLVAGGLLLAGR